MITQEQSFIQAIYADPDDVAARLIFADWLEEHPKCEVCRKCYGSGKRSVAVTDPRLAAANGYSPLHTFSEWRGCSFCGGDYDKKGAGHISDGRAEHAELIRTQIEIVRLQNANVAALDNCTGLSASWCPVCGDCECEDRSLSLDDESCPLHRSRSFHSEPEKVGQKIEELQERERILIASVVQKQLLFNLGFVWHLGFVEQLTCSSKDWVANADTITLYHPVRRVELTDIPELIDRYPNDPGHSARWRLKGRLPNHEVISQSRPINSLIIRLLNLHWPHIAFGLPGVKR